MYIMKSIEEMTEVPEEKNYFKQYLFFWGGQLFSRLGSTIVQFVLVLWIAIETQSELILGVASIAAFGPFLILGPIAGVIGEYVAIAWVFLGTAVLGLIFSSAIWFLTKAPQIDQSITEILEKQEQIVEEPPTK